MQFFIFCYQPGGVKMQNDLFLKILCYFDILNLQWKLHVLCKSKRKKAKICLSQVRWGEGAAIFPLNQECWSNKQTRSDTFHQRRSLDRSNIFGKNFSFACFGFISLLCIIRSNDNIYSFLSHLNQEILGQEDTFFSFCLFYVCHYACYGT